MQESENTNNPDTAKAHQQPPHNEGTHDTGSALKILLPQTASWLHLPVILLLQTYTTVNSIFFSTNIPKQIEKDFSVTLSDNARALAHTMCVVYVITKNITYVQTRWPVILKNPACGTNLSDPNKLRAIIKNGMRRYRDEYSGHTSRFIENDARSSQSNSLRDKTKEHLAIQSALGKEITEKFFGPRGTEPSTSSNLPWCSFNSVKFVSLIGFIDALMPFVTGFLAAKTTKKFLLPEDDSSEMLVLILVFTYISLFISQKIYFDYRNPDNQITNTILWEALTTNLSNIKKSCCRKESNSPLLGEAPSHNYFNSNAFKLHVFISCLTGLVDGLFNYFSHNKAMQDYNASTSIQTWEPVIAAAFYFSTVMPNALKPYIIKGMASQTNNNHDDSNDTEALQEPTLPVLLKVPFYLNAIIFVTGCGLSAAMVMFFTLRKAMISTEKPSFNSQNISHADLSNRTNLTPSPSSEPPHAEGEMIIAATLSLLSCCLTMRKIWGFSIPKAYKNTADFYHNCKRLSPNTNYDQAGKCQQLQDNFFDCISRIRIFCQTRQHADDQETELSPSKLDSYGSI